VTSSRLPGDHLLSDLQPIARYQVETEEQPAAQLLIDRVVPVAENVLGDLGQQRLGVTQRQTVQARALVHLPTQHFGPQAVSLPRTLHDDLVIARLAAQHQGDADHAVPAGHCHLGSRTVLGGGNQRKDAGSGKVRENQIVARLVQRVAYLNLDPFKIAGQPREILRRQRRKNPVELKRLDYMRHCGFGSIWMHPMDNSLG